MSLVDDVKTFLVEEKHRIALHDAVAKEVRKAAASTAAEHFSVQGVWSREEFIDRVGRYEAAVDELTKAQTLLSYWGTAAHEQTMALVPTRLSDDLKPLSGLVIWNALRWYPVFLAVYAGGVAAVAARRYKNLRLILHAAAPDPDRSQGRLSVLRAMVAGLGDAGSAFKELPGLERRHAPLSDHLFDRFRATLDDLLYLGADYESAFDEFEVLLALEHAEQYSRDRAGEVWRQIR